MTAILLDLWLRLVERGVPTFDVFPLDPPIANTVFAALGAVCPRRRRSPVFGSDGRLFDPDYDGPIDGRNFEKSDAVNPDKDPRDLEFVISLSDGEIRFTDQHLGRSARLLCPAEVGDVGVEENFAHRPGEHGLQGATTPVANL
jgi:hypothetical protein